MKSDLEYCDKCGEEILRDTRYAIAAIPVSVNCVAVGESCVLCSRCYSLFQKGLLEEAK